MPGVQRKPGVRDAPGLHADHCPWCGVRPWPAANSCQEFNGGRELETLQSCLQIIAFFAVSSSASSSAEAWFETLPSFVQIIPFVREFISASRRCLHIIAFAKEFISGKQLNLCPELNRGWELVTFQRGQELEALQSCRHIIVFVGEFILGLQFNRCQELG